MNKIVSFYLGESPGDFGRRIEDIWAFSAADLKDVHNYIQRLFPLPTPSQFQRAPLLDSATIQAFQSRQDLRDRLLVSLDVMLRFYGLRREGERVVRAEDFDRRARNWLTPYNHNFLRITRILNSLTLLGLPEWAGAFFAQLQEIYKENKGVVGAETFQYWSSPVGITL